MSDLAAVVAKPDVDIVLAALREEGIYDDTRRLEERAEETVAIPITQPPVETDVRDVIEQVDPEPRITDLPTLLEGFPAEDVVVRGQIRARLDLNVLFAEGLFADRSLDERKFDRRAVESVSRIQREDAVPLRDGTPLDADTTYDLTPDADDPLPDAVRVAIPFITDHGGAVYARLDLDDRLRDTTDTEEFRDVFAGGKALVRGKVRATVDLAALFDARIVDGAVDPGTMYMPPSA